MDHLDLLDLAEAVLLAPLVEHPEQLDKFRRETLYAPLPGSKTAKKKAKLSALAAMGIDPKSVKPGMGMARTKGAKVAKGDT